MKEGPHAVDVHVGKTIRIKRLMRKVSQTELGDRVGVTFQQIQKYEKGSNRVSASMLVEIAGALDVDVRSFFEDVNPNSANAKELYVIRKSNDGEADGIGVSRTARSIRSGIGASSTGAKAEPSCAASFFCCST